MCGYNANIRECEPLVSGCLHYNTIPLVNGRQGTQKSNFWVHKNQQANQPNMGLKHFFEDFALV